LFSYDALAKLQELRLQIPLDITRKTCPRRFLTEKQQVDDNTKPQHHEDGWVGALIDSAVLGWNLTHRLRSLPWYRFLEYSEGGYMNKHTDGSNLHPETMQRSVATMMIYLSTCSTGGETTLYRKCKKRRKHKGKRNDELSDEPDVIERIRPVWNTALIFPHGWQHSGDHVEKESKIALRVDLTWAEPP